ncbi:hypothetical protein [Streptosporangium sp. NPDC000396]|uniref:hypothetical protein n=1 Tax=Streptosporangium sp. NPDC000396 TaxID=3366185 RepID=UPI003679237A
MPTPVVLVGGLHAQARVASEDRPLKGRPGAVSIHHDLREVTHAASSGSSATPPAPHPRPQGDRLRSRRIPRGQACRNIRKNRRVTGRNTREKRVAPDLASGKQLSRSHYPKGNELNIRRRMTMFAEARV